MLQVCRGRNVCPANSVGAQIQKTVIESEIGNERAFSDSVKCTAVAPVARLIYNKSSLSALHIFPRFHQSSFCIFFCLLYSVLLPALSFLSTHSSLRLPGFGVLKQNCGFINKSKDAQASPLHMSSVRNTKAVRYKSSSHSVCKQKDGQLTGGKFTCYFLWTE